jgi:hypothetical protein
MTWQVGPLLLILTLVGGTARAAQDRPVVFLHGLQSSPAAWEGAAGRLQTRLQVAPHRPTLDWQQPYAQQADSLHLSHGFAVLPAATVAVGHSNGGIVARQWGRSRALSGIVTVGTPHAGAPIVSRFSEWYSFSSTTPAYLASISQAFSRPSNTSWVMAHLNPLLGWAIEYGRSTVFAAAAAAGIDWRLPVMADMRPGSPFLIDLNSSANLAREAAALPARAGVVSYAHNFYWAGPLRAALPEYADAVATALYGTIAGLDFWATWILANSAHGDPDAINQAMSLFSLSVHLASIDPVYCAVISSVASNLCVPNDGIVPHTSQRYPGALNVVVGEHGTWGPVHTRLTEQSDDVLYQLLAGVMQIPPRGASPAPPPPVGPDPDPLPPPGDAPEEPEPGGGNSGGTRPDVLAPGDLLGPEEYLSSADGRFALAYQGDGNLVLYEDGQALWHSGTHVGEAGQVVMQHDGNLVIYSPFGEPLWASETAGWHDAWLIVQNDGNVVLYSSAGEPLWATNTAR